MRLSGNTYSLWWTGINLMILLELPKRFAIFYFIIRIGCTFCQTVPISCSQPWKSYIFWRWTCDGLCGLKVFSQTQWECLCRRFGHESVSATGTLLKFCIKIATYSLNALWSKVPLLSLSNEQWSDEVGVYILRCELTLLCSVIGNDRCGQHGGPQVQQGTAEVVLFDYVNTLWAVWWMFERPHVIITGDWSLITGF